MNIRIFYDITNYRFRGWRKAEDIIVRIIDREGLIAGEVIFIITSDDILRPINAEFLNHDYNTDVIAFDYGSGKTVSGEIYISRDTVKANSSNYNVSLKSEMLRVMIHGVLHLTGYKDRTLHEKNKMRRMEERWIKEYFE